MPIKAIIPRKLALRDVEDAVDYYTREAGSRAALGYIEELQNAYKLLASHPASGSLRYGYEIGLPGLRSVQVRRYPYLIFYLEQTGHIDVWRVLHAKMDIPAWLQNPSS
ncbi:type II toxin-antitoxin system RelE/ParE family toxin [Mesorhizobium sp. B2-4-9]|nr:type II toxin-antitoxin system RelE/ParE family toxin [Mesorhizobium sp. B2-5-2]TPL25197.1 type II toxin-antitoxin system RelE/ParE family toxin [Mesorhizobium sp. B2-4-7]TPL29143.1 type II toxin-antitoxin system RelE/ParE family toxin [Mesorhizobium sp. B2-4-9]TPL34808.1 type II toxin-antitoxin system RelE/ParE family toxin [Mesorhizobium sp. B2-4-8]TPL40961.1 type II toxin-antitoxin system RelE/ParE family toxin [Mesorhizobium sp. B2-4-5]TPL50511.1 type II toxin-antitoxin system RelE/ParE